MGNQNKPQVIGSLRRLYLEPRPEIEVKSEAIEPEEQIEEIKPVERVIAPSHRIDARDIDYGWAGKFKDEGVFTTPIEPKDGIIAMPKASRGLSLEEPVSPDVEEEPESEIEEEEVEKKSLMADIRRSFTDLMGAIRRER